MDNLENAKKYFLEGLNALSNKEYCAAIACFKKSLHYYPNRVSTLINLSAAQIKNKNVTDAKASLELLDTLESNLYESKLNWGLLYILKRNHSLAIEFFYKAHLINQKALDPILNLAYSHHEISRFDEALAYSKKCLVIDPNFIEAHTLQAKIFASLKNPLESHASLKRAFQINHKHPFLIGDFLHQKLYICDWSSYQKDLGLLQGHLNDELPVIAPFKLLSLIDDPEKHLRCATKYTEYEHPNLITRTPSFNKTNHVKIKLGYFSADFHNHAVSNLIAELFELHDQARFEIYLFSFAPKTNDSMQSRIFSNTKNIHYIGNTSDEEVASLAKKFEIDIAIDLMGYTTNYRADILNNRCAPIQVSYLGYPSTMGADFIDYLIADEVVIPQNQREFYSEKIAYIPGSYQMNDTKRKISEKRFSKKELSLPEDAFIFCCFNNNYKINPKIFTIWMNILQRVPNSVLWLLEDNKVASKNLYQEAEKRGINSERIKFAARIETSEHLARQRAADLFLDTWPYNAHTTGSDALWVGLPIITYAGESFCSRVGASLLNAALLPELITFDLSEYEELAVSIANNHHLLSQLKEKLVNKREIMPLFNSQGTTKSIENAYSEMYSRYINGLSPSNIYIK
jgi:predicted O-linked N-acetylglucosamine transferase (SPINDLY family)